MTNPWDFLGDDESAARRLAEWLLIESVKDLEHRARPDASVYEQLGIASTLRRTLMDKHPVLHRARARLALPEPMFSFTPHPVHVDPEGANLKLAAQFGNLDTPELSHSAGLDGFLAAPAAWSFGKPISVREVVRYFAHAHGGVHLGAPETDFERVVQRVASIMPHTSGGWTGSLAGLARIVVRALDPLVAAIEAAPYPPHANT